MTVAKTIARAWTDAGFKDKLMNDPHAALAEAGVKVPEGVKINVVENTANTHYLVLPVAPDEAGQVPAGELEKIAGGTPGGTALGSDEKYC